MEGTLPSVTLPDELIERIVLKLPFPALFEARWLSRAWRARFSSHSELTDEAEKRLAISFQKQARSRAKDWGTFFPVQISKESCSAFDWGSRNWVPLPSLSFLPEHILKWSEPCSHGANSGLLVMWSPIGPRADRLYVANIFTRSYKLLPPYPPSYSADRVWFARRLFMDSPSGPYKVIGISQEVQGRDLPWSLLVYESKTDAWRIIKVVYLHFAQLMRSVCLHGVLYMVPPLVTPQSPNVPRQMRQLRALNLEEGTCEDLEFVCNADLHIPIRPFSFLFVWNDQVVMVTHVSFNSVIVLKVNLVSRELLEMSRGPPDSLKGDFSKGSPDCHGDYIFFPGIGRGRVVYNMLENEWSLFEVPPLPRHLGVEKAFQCPRGFFQLGLTLGSFQPGLTPGSFQPGFDPFWTV